MKENTMQKMLLNRDSIGLWECFSSVKREFKHSETITTFSSDYDTIGILSSGTVYLCTINSDGHRRILDYYVKGDIFGKRFIPDSENELYYFMAKTDCKIDFVKYKNLITCCSKSCDRHIDMIDYIVMSTSIRSLIHIDILGQGTLRSKLLLFFEYLKEQKKSTTFSLPMPFSDLADYLSTNRSAMMREIKSMTDDGIIKCDKRKITLL